MPQVRVRFLDANLGYDLSVSIYNKTPRVQTKPIELLSGAQMTAFTFAALSLALTLLVVFMTDTPIIDDGVSLDLPKVSSPHSLWRAQREDALVVAVMCDGNVFFGNDRVAPDRLGRALLESLLSTRENKVYIRADGRVPWWIVALVIDAAREAGIPQVAFFADQRRSAVSQ